MLKITKIADYGFALLTYMAAQDLELLHNAKDLAVATQLALPTVSKVLKILTQGQLLDSHQGSHGGYTLARHPSEITAADILGVIEGPVSITDCSSIRSCDRLSFCQVSPSLLRVNNSFVDSLQNLSLEAIVLGGSNSTMES